MGLERFTSADRRRGAAGPGPVARAFGERREPPVEVCEFCSAPVGDAHRHVVDLEERGLQCTCRACALLFTEPGAGRHRTVPEDYRHVESFTLRPGQWAALRVPVDLVFVMHDSRQHRPVAFYPSPAGATESELTLQAWDDVVAANPTLADLAPDVEAALVRVRSGHDPEAYVVPIDRCYELVGHLRLNWRGFGGGQEVRARIDDFFHEVRSRARNPAPKADA